MIPTYFRSSDLVDLLDSLERQTVKPLEMIIVDDTPTEEVKAVCEEHKSKFDLIFIKNPGKRSAAVARNVGVEMSRGNMVMFLDSDMVLHPDYIEKILSVFKNRKDAIGVQGWIQNLQDRGGWRLLYSRIIGSGYYTENTCNLWQYPVVLDQVIPCEWLSSSNMMLKREVFEKGFKFDENLSGYSYMEDVLLSHSLYKHYNKSGLYITPHAKIFHKESRGGRHMDPRHIVNCRKYVYWRLFGWRGILRHYRVTFGLTLLKMLQGACNDIHKK